MKYTFKKIGAALLGLTLAITSLTGCGAKNAAQDTQALIVLSLSCTEP